MTPALHMLTVGNPYKLLVLNPACTALQEDKYRQHGFDLRRYERLQRDVRRYERYLRRATDQHVSVFPDEEKVDVGGVSGARLTS